MKREAPSKTAKLAAEGRRATKLLRGKTVAVVRRHRAGEILIEFTDHSRIFVDGEGELEISIAGTDDDE
ncbi:hypothetical protein [Usitatibacter palustris]|uniref:Uncharacterized protein n=1 Tax=Usitatibacter palustris TaxID=2732487 RepID=A0A6M4H2J7_9PROT|nr:hypothetical protein [Usitatibacter palustris]QJR13545.1 hypothetical protein DSM104440_00329 [Usitatibacter palustris]